VAFAQKLERISILSFSFFFFPAFLRCPILALLPFLLRELQPSSVVTGVKREPDTSLENGSSLSSENVTLDFSVSYARARLWGEQQSPGYYFYL
jgi:hypothetical protein